jgi:peptide/nickel transport system permease protein
MSVNMVGAPAADNADQVPETGAPRRTRIIDTWSGRLGLAGMGFVLAVAVVGRLVVPHGPAELLTTPYSHPSARLLLGTDQLGRDVLARVLDGGLRMIMLSFSATLVAYVLGVTLGLLSAYLRGRWDSVIMRALDVLLAFPPILLVLVLASGRGQGLATIFAGAVLVNIPGSARVVRSAGLEVVTMPFVEAARLRGESLLSVLRREILPNIRGAVIADAGPRLSGTIILIAGLNYLGIGVNPPTPDWGAMIYENRGGLTIQPWAVIVPALMIVLVVVSANLLGEAYLHSRSTGRSKESA